MQISSADSKLELLSAALNDLSTRHHLPALSRLTALATAAAEWDPVGVAPERQPLLIQATSLLLGDSNEVPWIQLAVSLLQEMPDGTDFAKALLPIRTITCTTCQLLENALSSEPCLLPFPAAAVCSMNAVLGKLLPAVASAWRGAGWAATAQHDPEIMSSLADWLLFTRSIIKQVR